MQRKIKKLTKKWMVLSLMIALLVSCIPAITSGAASKGYVFKYNGVSVKMKGDASKLMKKAGKVLKKKESKSCAYKGLDRVYQYKDFVLATYSESKKGKQYVNGIRFRTDKVATKEGIHLGSSLDDVFEKYGQTKGNFGVYTYKKGKSKLQFEVTDNKVTTIQYVALK